MPTMQTRTHNEARGRRLLAGLAAGAAMFIAGAPAHAEWAPPKDDVSASCSAYAKISGVLFQECVVTTPHANGAWVQSFLAVSNTTSTARRVRGETHTYIDGGYPLSFTNCADRTLAGYTRLWCWGTTTNVSGHGRSVYGTGHLYDYMFQRRGSATSPVRLT